MGGEKKRVESNGEFEPKILVFACNWCSYAGADTAGVSRIQYSPKFRVIRVMCSGRVRTSYVLKAFQLGAGGLTDFVNKFLNRQEPHIFAAEQPRGYSPPLDLILADYQHIGYFLKLGLADFEPQAFIAVIQIHPDVLPSQALMHASGILLLLIGDGQQHRLNGCQPHRKSAGVVFGQHA